MKSKRDNRTLRRGESFANTGKDTSGLILYRDVQAVRNLPPIELPRCFDGNVKSALEALTNACCGD